MCNVYVRVYVMWVCDVCVYLHVCMHVISVCVCDVYDVISVCVCDVYDVCAMCMCVCM